MIPLRMEDENWWVLSSRKLKGHQPITKASSLHGWVSLPTFTIVEVGSCLPLFIFHIFSRSKLKVDVLQRTCLRDPEAVAEAVYLAVLLIFARRPSISVAFHWQSIQVGSEVYKAWQTKQSVFKRCLVKQQFPMESFGIIHWNNHLYIERCFRFQQVAVLDSDWFGQW